VKAPWRAAQRRVTIILGQNQTVVSQNVAGNHLTRCAKWQAYASPRLCDRHRVRHGHAQPDLARPDQDLFLETNQDNDQYTAAGWSEVDARVVVAGEAKRWDVSLYARNLFDKRYIPRSCHSPVSIATLNTPRVISGCVSDAKGFPMRLLTFLGSSGPEAGALDPAGQIVPLSRSGLPALASIRR
jgi:hypothetical protein